MSTKTTIFFTGATGYIGGAVLTRLLKHPKISTFEITALIRSQNKADKIKPFGVNPLVGSLQDLEKQASGSDIIISAADSDDLPATLAILRGLKKRYENTGKVPIILHTSGTDKTKSTKFHGFLLTETGVLTDKAAGLYPGKVTYDDTDPEQIASLADTQIHHDVDLALVGADAEGYVKSYVVLPSTIYGLATGPLVDIGFQHGHSIQITGLLKSGLERGQGGIVGQGKNIWSCVHIDDNADLYIVIFDAFLNGNPDHGHNGYYFAENGEYTAYDTSKKVAELLFAIGKGKTPEPTAFTQEELDKWDWIGPLSENSRARGVHSRSLGWSPKYTGPDDLLTSIKPELEVLLWT